MNPTASGATSLFRPVAVAPSYNNAGTLADVLDRLATTGLPAILVNDGSTDATAAIAARWRDADSRQRHVLSHSDNRGKAAALRAAFDQASALGFTHAVTIDTDGQLAPEDVAELLARSARKPDALVIGVRDESAAEYPT